MNQNNQIDDDSATLTLAKQIGMKSSCIPEINLPNTEHKYRIAHWKLAMKHFQAKQNKITKAENHLGINNLKEIKQEKMQRRPATSGQSRRFRNSSTHKQMGRSWGDEDLRAQTARTTSNRTNYKLSSTYSSKLNKTEEKVGYKSKSKRHKNLLVQLWNPQDYFCNKSQIMIQSNKHMNFKNMGNTSKSQPKSNTRIQYNMYVKSFQFC